MILGYKEYPNQTSSDNLLIHFDYILTQNTVLNPVI